MLVPGRVKRYRMTEVGFSAKESFFARLSLVDAQKVVACLKQARRNPYADTAEISEDCGHVETS
jgi:hypothetical protein